jgi:alanine-glyoxylate transaminase/serine-glyoxylate transaminase/serine-pyruvate transaminase
MPDEVLQAMHRPALDIYSDTMVQLTDGLLHDLSRLFATKGHSYIYIANGHGAWEAVLSNVLSRRQDSGAGKRPFCRQLGQRRRRHGR